MTLAFTSGITAQNVPPDLITSQPAPPPPRLGPGQTPSPNDSGTRTPTGAVHISGGVMAGQIVKKIFPTGVPCGNSGAVVMHAIIGTNGKVEKLTLISGRSDAVNAAAMNAARQWEYKPYLVNGVPVKVDTTIAEVMDTNGCPNNDR
jgi:TonB family protein